MDIRHHRRAGLRVLVAVTGLAYIGSLQSDSYRCGSKLVRTGDTSGRVLQICGAPKHKDRGRQEIRIKGKPRDVAVERWYYQKGSQRLGRVVLLYRGKVVAIETQGR
jgi:hypothetical protein